MVDLEEFDEDFDLVSEISRVRNSHAKMRTRLDISRALEKELTRERDEAVRRVEVYETAANLKPPKWLKPKRPKKSAAMAVAMLSDCHFDEVVKITEVPSNAYDREIAEKRLQTFCRKVIQLSLDQISGVDIDGLVLMLGGDLVSGNLHDLSESNETPYGPVTVAYWSTQLAAAIKLLSDSFKKVHVVSVVGNHGRLTRKPRTKGRARDSMDWLLVHSAHQQLTDLDNVTWQIPETHDAFVEIYDTRFLLTHGDTVSGGQGIGGIWPPIKRLQSRLMVNQPHDCLVLGHFHQLVQAGTAGTAGLIVNGSLKGFDEYARVCGFASEPAMQAWWIVVPEKGITMQAPVFVEDRKSEGW